jgi:hypothetical protein
VEIDVAAGRDRVELTVHDDGVGISPDRTRFPTLDRRQGRAAEAAPTLAIMTLVALRVAAITLFRHRNIDAAA